jgi:hypothetical protein
MNMFFFATGRDQYHLDSARIFIIMIMFLKLLLMK